MPQISVIVPVYKVESYLHRCIDSVLGQSYQDFELILIDDGSPDNCGAICDAYAEKDNRIHVIHQENGGLSAARNAGIDWAFANSDSRWFAFVDSDDWIHRDYLRFLMSAVEYDDVKVAVCKLFWTAAYTEDTQFGSVEHRIMDSEQALVEHHAKCICAPSKLFARALFQNIRFPVGKLYEDAFVTHLLLLQSPKVAVLEEKLYYYYYNPDSITKRKWSDRMLDSIEAHELRLEYYQKNGYQKAYLREQEIYIEELTNKMRHLVDTRETKEEFSDTYLLLQEKLRLALPKARKQGLVRWNGETMWAYFFAMRTDMVWKSVSFIQKLYHKLKK